MADRPDGRPRRARLIPVTIAPNEPVRRRGVPSPAPLLVGAVAIAAVALVGGSCGGRSGLGGTAPSPDSSQPVPTSSPSESSTASFGAKGDLVATDAGLRLTVSFEPTDVAPGGSLKIDVVIRNDRSVPVVLLGPCGAPSMFALVPVPVEPVGRDWDGIAGKFKTYALTQGLGPIDHPEATSRRVDATGTCDEGGSDTLEPGDSTSASVTWKAELVKGVPAPPGDIPVNISVGHDPSGEPPSYPPDYKGLISGWYRTYEQLTVEGVIRIVGDAPKIVTAGQALDSMLADRKFAAWLSGKPKGTWSGANLFLVNYGGAQGIVPAGPSWEIDLFREIGVPRNWAIGFVDPFTAKLSNLTFCNHPCDR